jgi:hypothetical protein
MIVVVFQELIQGGLRFGSSHEKFAGQELIAEL